MFDEAHLYDVHLSESLEELIRNAIRLLANPDSVAAVTAFVDGLGSVMRLYPKVDPTMLESITREAFGRLVKGDDDLPPKEEALVPVALQALWLKIEHAAEEYDGQEDQVERAGLALKNALLTHRPWRDFGETD